jgi:hypothetical protein
MGSAACVAVIKSSRFTLAPQYMGSAACVAVIKSSRFTVVNFGNSRCCVVSKKGQVYDLLLIKAYMNLTDTLSIHSNSIPTVP